MPTPIELSTSVLGAAGTFGTSFPLKAQAVSEAYSTWLASAQVTLMSTGLAGPTGVFSAVAAGVPGTAFMLQGLLSSGNVGTNVEFLARAFGVGLFSIPHALTGITAGCASGVGTVTGFIPTMDLGSLIRISYAGKGMLPSFSETNGIALGITLSIPTMFIGRSGPIVGAPTVPTVPVTVPSFGKII